MDKIPDSNKKSDFLRDIKPYNFEPLENVQTVSIVKN